jgi:hypothetical protein
MRIGNVELTHNAPADNFDFKINPLEKDGEVLKVSVKVADFIQKFICEGEELSTEEEQAKTNNYFQKYQLEKDPYNPELAEGLIEFLKTMPLEVVPQGEPAFPMGITLQWNDKKKQIQKNVYGLDEDLVSMFHVACDNDPQIEMVLSIVQAERTQRMKDVLAMEEKQAEKDGQ